MQIIPLASTLRAIQEALRDGAKVYAIHYNENGCGRWHRIRKTVNDDVVLCHDSGEVTINSVAFNCFQINTFIGVI